MTRIRIVRRIHAAPEVVFRAVSDIERLPETSPDIQGVEFLSDRKFGVGTRFRETRLMKGREHITELEVTEYEKNTRVRMVADSHGTVWDTVFKVAPSGDGTELELIMDARAHKLLPRLLNPVMKGLFRRGIEKHLDGLEAYCKG